MIHEWTRLLDKRCDAPVQDDYVGCVIGDKLEES